MEAVGAPELTDERCMQIVAVFVAVGGMDANAVHESNGRSILLAAVAAGYSKTVLRLLKLQCNVELQDDEGNTAFHLVSQLALFDSLMAICPPPRSSL
jgi:hypothetical protein